ncbi:MAG: nitrilase-related carbon-nitrogen hydrolase [Bdellovibrionota bacterium]
MVRVAFLNFVTGKDVQANIDQVAVLMGDAKAKGADWVFLPEMWTHQTACMDEFREKSVEASVIVLKQIKKLALQHSLDCFAGSWTEEVSGQNKFYNTQYVISSQGEVVGKYRKVHLFKMDDGSDDPYRETKKFIPGAEAVSIELNSWNIVLSTCFDIRFPEFYLSAGKRKAADLITLPSAFLQRTGRDHWEVLLRARAIENQSYVIASNRIVHDDPRIESYFGHSMVVDPWGKVFLIPKMSSACLW